MQKQVVIRVLMVLVITFTAAFFVLATSNRRRISEEECSKYQQEGCEKQMRSGFLIESLTRNLLGK